MTMLANTQIDVKIKNQKRIINYLLSSGPATRADLAKVLNASKPTISKNVEDLISQDIILELGKADNQLGKKGIFIDINKAHSYIIAVDLSKKWMRFSVNNLKGEVIGFQKHSYDTSLTEHEILNSLLNESKISIKSVKKVVVAYPGVVGHNGQYYLSNLKQKESKMIGFVNYLKTEFASQVIVKNDINLAILAEKVYNGNLAKDNLYYISFETGVGSGIIINGQLYEGDRNAAGEIGFIIPSQMNSKITYKTLEELVSLDAILERYNSLLDSNISLEIFEDRLINKEEAATNLYRDVVETISIAISNVTSILDIEHVIISGAVLNIKSSMAQDIQKRVNEVSPLKTQIIKSTLDQSALKGCIYMGIQEVVEALV